MNRRKKKKKRNWKKKKNSNNGNIHKMKELSKYLDVSQKDKFIDHSLIN